MTGREALLNIPGILMSAKNWYNNKGCWYLEADIARMQGIFKSVEKASPKDGVVGVEHVNDIKNDVFCVRVLRCAE
jgi:hypothetical protein